MSAVQDSYLGISEELTYATGVAPARFLEMIDESLVGKYDRIDSAAYRAGQRVAHKDRFQPNPKGADGSLNLEMLDGSFGLLLKHALGVSSVGTAVGGFTPQTVTVGDLRGKSLTVQVGRTDNAGLLSPFTYEGGKIKSWELTSAVDGVLGFKVDLDFAKETIGAGAGAYALSVPTYNTTAQLFTFVAGFVQVGGVEFAVHDVSIKGDNGLKTDRWFLRSAGGKKEPLEEGMRKYTFDLKGEFEGLAHATRVASLLATGAVATMSAQWVTPQGGQLTVTIPVARFDEGPTNFSGAKIIEQPLKGIVMWDGTTSPLTLVYKSKDIAP